MKWFVCALCLSVFFSANTTFGRGLRHRGHGSTSASTNAPIDDAPVYQVENQLLEAVNDTRQRYGLGALVLDTMLHRTARQHCGWMANHHNMIHSSGHIENIAMGQPTVESVMNAWMNSPGHRANILNPSHTRIGLSGYASPSGTAFWCQQFK